MKTIIGIVVSTKMTNTVVVERPLTHKHELYKKVLRSTARVKAHTEMPLVVGDKVKLIATAPISKEKFYKVVEKLS